ncbi:MAG: HD domain-containing protein [Clostridia bacterium]|nr:HD domain-containing protein [Clostridia bacterium]
MNPEELLKYMALLSKLKDTPRHCWSPEGRRESVAEHCWRLAMMALLIKDKIQGIDTDRLIKICLVHDLGEAITGDIPTFEKTESDELTEQKAIDKIFADMPKYIGDELKELYYEYENQSTTEGRLAKALDKCEALDQHNQSDINTWLPFEYDLQMTYGTKECEEFPYMKELRDMLRNVSKTKIEEEEKAKDKQ